MAHIDQLVAELDGEEARIATESEQREIVMESFPDPADVPELIAFPSGQAARLAAVVIREHDDHHQGVAKEDADERHICPLQLDFIDRCVRLWSNPGEVVFDPFGGIGSTPHEAVRLGRRGLACELKPSYWKTACDNLRRVESEVSAPSLMDGIA